MRRRRLRPKDYGRCARCGRLTERESLTEGPEGALYGPDCLAEAVRAWVTDVTAPGRVRGSNDSHEEAK